MQLRQFGGNGGRLHFNGDLEKWVIDPDIIGGNIDWELRPLQLEQEAFVEMMRLLGVPKSLLADLCNKNFEFPKGLDEY